MSKKDKKVILVAQCLVNPYCRVHILGQNFPLSQELTNYLMGKRVGIIQYPCPETTAMRLTCFIGLENSPTCGIHWGRHKVNRYQTESPNPVDKPDPNEPVLKGIMAEILEEELAKEKIKVPFLEFPTQSEPSSEKRKKFWEELATTVESSLFSDASPGQFARPGGNQSVQVVTHASLLPKKIKGENGAAH